MIYKILLMGPQGSGKGTQAKLLSDKLNIPALSMGQLLREEVVSGSKLGKEINEIIHVRGDLVPDDMAMEVLTRRLEQADAKNGYILDGYPRNRKQQTAFDLFDTATQAVLLQIPREETMKRLMKRAGLEGRVDDTEELISHRLDIYENETRPVVELYREKGILKEVDGVGSVEEIQGRIVKVLNL